MDKTELKIIDMDYDEINLAVRNAEAAGDALVIQENIISLRDNIEELTDAYDKAHKEKRRWKVIFLINLVILLCILLYSCSLSLYRVGLNAYTVVWSADMLEVQKDNIRSMSTKELIDESVKNGYVSNAIEFYYDPVDNLIYDTAGGSTTYYSVPSLNNNIVGYELKYDIKDFKKGGKLQDSITKVANQKFIWGINDGSGQMAVPESTDLKFNGYSKTLVDKYMSTLETYQVKNTGIVIAIDKEFEVDKNFIYAMLDGVSRDYYLANKGEYKKVNMQDVDFYYGFKSDDEHFYYVPSHGASDTTNWYQDPEVVDITDALEANIERYTGEDVTLSTKATKNSGTVIYLSSENYLYDNFYIANLLELY